MSQFESTSEQGCRICPYCKTEMYVECEEYSEDYRIEECGECGKKFHAMDVFSVDHHAKPDCALNGIEHVWKQYNSPTRGLRNFCEVCGELQKVMT